MPTLLGGQELLGWTDIVGYFSSLAGGENVAKRRREVDSQHFFVF